MREILFRGKRIDNEVWVFGSLLIDGEAHKPASKENLSFSKHYIVPETDAENIQTRFNDGAFYLNTIAYHIIPETVGRFTGLTYKKGKKIFDGDIVAQSWYDHDEPSDDSFGEVVFCEYDCSFSVMDVQKYDIVPLGRCHAYHFEAEVIGNIHDNPELLGGAEDVKTENR